MFSWTQQGFAQYAPGAITIGNDVVEWAYIGSVKSAYGKLTGSAGASLAQKIEANALRRLTEKESSLANAHFLSRHGSGTTLAQQEFRSLSGMTPDGVQKTAVNSTRFLSYQDQLAASTRAETIFNGTGQLNINFDMGKTIGEGYLKYGGYRTTSQVSVFLSPTGKAIIIFPLIR